jgi:hypothetical protein
MRFRRRLHLLRRRGVVLLPVLALLTVLACLDEPDIDETWTKLEFLSVTPGPKQSRSGSQPINVSLEGRVTYRRILTGHIVAEVRYSPTIPPSSVLLNPSEHTLDDAQDIDNILANSVTTGRATRITTGFDHLMQDVNLAFTAQVPAGAVAGTGGLYLLLYMGEGDEVEQEDGTDSLVVTPFRSGDKEILHTGFALTITP